MADEPDPREPDARDDATAVLAYALFCVSIVLFAAGYIVHQWRASAGIDREGAMSVLLVSSVFTAALGVVLTLLLIRRWRLKPERERLPLCAHCLRPHLEFLHFCPTCSRPLSFFAATAWYENVYAQMWGVGKAAHHPTRRVHVIGLVLVAAPTLLAVLTYAGWYVLRWGQREAWWARTPTEQALNLLATSLAFLLLLLTLGIALRLMWLSLRNWHRYRTNPDALPPESTYGHAPWWTHDRDLGLEARDGDQGPDPADPEIIVSSG